MTDERNFFSPTKRGCRNIALCNSTDEPWILKGKVQSGDFQLKRANASTNIILSEEDFHKYFEEDTRNRDI